jgi:hypothetical protein
MGKPPASERNSSGLPRRTPAGRRSGRGASSVLPYLSEQANSRPAPLDGDDAPQPAKRPRWLRW